MSKDFSLDFMDDLPVQPTSRKKDFDDPLAGTSARDVSQASGRKTDAKGRIRKTIFLPPDMIWEIDQTIEAEGYTSKMDFYHWLIVRGWQAWKDGVRPDSDSAAAKEIRL